MKIIKNNNAFSTNKFTKAFVEKFQINDFNGFSSSENTFEVREIKEQFGSGLSKIEKEFDLVLEQDDCITVFPTAQDFLTREFINHIEFRTEQSEDLSRFMFAFIIDKQEIVNEMVEKLIKVQNDKNEMKKGFFDKETGHVFTF